MTRIALLVLVVAACGGKGVGDSQARLRKAVEAKTDTLDDCYEKTLARDAEVKGDLQVVLKVPKGGSTVKSQVVGGKIDAKLQKCVQNALDAVELSPGPGADMEVTYQLTFAPEG